MAKNQMKPYGRDIPEKSGNITANELPGSFLQTSDTEPKPAKKRKKNK